MSAIFYLRLFYFFICQVVSKKTFCDFLIFLFWLKFSPIPIRSKAIFTHTHTHTHTCIDTHTHTGTHTYVYTHMRVNTHADNQINRKDNHSINQLATSNMHSTHGHPSISTDQTSSIFLLHSQTFFFVLVWCVISFFLFSRTDLSRVLQ